jgi:hypothetical protein
MSAPCQLRLVAQLLPSLTWMLWQGMAGAVGCIAYLLLWEPPQNYVLEEFLPLPLLEHPATPVWHEPGNTPPTTWGEVDPWHPSWDQPQHPDSPICWSDEVAQLGWGLDASYLYDE